MPSLALDHGSALARYAELAGTLNNYEAAAQLGVHESTIRRWHRQLRDLGHDLPETHAGRPLVPHGTPGAARRHYRLGEDLCDECRQSERRARGPNGGAQSCDHRPVRNGMPETRPYVRGAPRPEWALRAVQAAIAAHPHPDDQDGDDR